MVFKIFIIVLAVWILLRLFASYREKRLDLINFIIWVLVWSGIIFTVLHPVWSEQLSNIVGIGERTDLAFFLAIFLLFYLVFRVYVKITSVESDVTELTKHIALINHELNLQKKNEKKAKKKKNRNS